MHSAMTSLVEFGGLLVAVFGAFGTILVGFYKYAQARERDFEESRKAQTNAFTDALQKLGDKIEADSKVTAELVVETRKGNIEAKQRNGHLGDQNVKIIELIAAHSKDVSRMTERVLNAVQNVKEQHVDTQIVEHQEDGGK